MSITKGEEAAEEASHNFLTNCVHALCRRVGVSYGNRLSEHVAHKSHEDIPSDAVKTPQEAAELEKLSQVVPLTLPVPKPKCPERLRPFLPPANFGAVVAKNIFRSAYPQPENFEFLKRLKLKTILTLVPEEIPSEYAKFMRQAGIHHFQHHIPANKGGIMVETCQMSNVLRIMLDRANHPMLVHCNKGKHRTGCAVGCFRKIQGERLETVFNEYHVYADPKARLLDECFIELFDERTVLWLAREQGWLPAAENSSPTVEWSYCIK